jgi:hypothetical protein
MNPKFFIGPMSKNVVDSIIEFCEKTENSIGLIPSRRQIEFDGGYVNNWKTVDFVRYVKSKTNKILIVRDHSGPGQGSKEDDGYESLSEDCKYFDVIHIDPWKKYNDYSSGLKKTIEMINFCHNINNNILFEVGTEESIKRFDEKELTNLILDLKNELDENVFKNIKYLVIQSGTSLLGNTQTGNYNINRLLSMVNISRNFNLISKEHNGDYIKTEIIYDKFENGLDCINIAPEFGVIETLTYLEEINDESLFLEFYNICFNSNKWIKWVSKDFVPENNKKELIKICGHYVLSNKDFINKIKNNFPNIDERIKENITKKINELFKIKN